MFSWCWDSCAGAGGFIVPLANTKDEEFLPAVLQNTDVQLCLFQNYLGETSGLASVGGKTEITHSGNYQGSPLQEIN